MSKSDSQRLTDTGTLPFVENTKDKNMLTKIHDKISLLSTMIKLTLWNLMLDNE